VQKPELLGAELCSNRSHPGDVAAGPVQARDQAGLHRVAAGVKTIGIVVVAALAARIAWKPGAMMTATRRRTSSAANSGSRPASLSAKRYSIATFAALDEAHVAQSLVESCENVGDGEPRLRNPTTGIGSCARATNAKRPPRRQA